MEPIKELSISGGGIRGYAYLGVLYTLWKRDLLSNLETIACVSVGSWLGAGICLGYTPKQIGDHFFQKDVSQIKDVELINFFQRKSLFKGEKLKEFVDNFIGEDITLVELYKRSKIHLIIVTVCLNTNSNEYLDHINSPDLNLKKALLMSSSIPGVFPPVEYNDKLYIDGGIIDNDPIHILGDGAWGIKNKEESNTHISINNMFDYTLYIFRLIYDKVNIVKKNKTQTIITVDESLAITSFDLTKDQKYRLIQNGIKNANKQINHKILQQALLELNISV